jgi:adenylate cyclase
MVRLLLGLSVIDGFVPLLRSRVLVHALIGAGVFFAMAGLYWLEAAGVTGQALHSVEYWFRDAILTRGGRLNPPDDRLVFLGIDDASRSLNDVDLQMDFPEPAPEDPGYRALSLMTARYSCWSREIYALLCERLLAAGARAVLFDVRFSQPEQGDDAFRAILLRFPDRIALASELVQQPIGPDQQAWKLALPDVSSHHPSIGYVNFWAGPDGRIRHARYQTTLEQLQIGPAAAGQGTPVSSLALIAATKLGPVNLNRPFDRHLFRYTGPPGTYLPVPMHEVFIPDYWKQNYNSGAAFRDKLVLVGATGSILHDDHPTPFGAMPGTEIHLNSINALLHNAFLRELPPWTGDLLIASAVIVAWLLTVFIAKTWLRLGAVILFGAGYFYLVKALHDQADTIILATPPVLAFGVATLGSFIFDFTRETLEKLRIRRTLEAYVSKDVVREVLDNPETYFSKLGGQRASVALMMTDLRGFTTMSEEMDSQQLVTQLNEYMSLMVDDIFSRRGSIDKFIGDAILAVWGHVQSEGPARDVTLAIEAALLMKESLERLNADWRNRGLRTFQMGCGVNFGEVVFGNIGSARKMEPTVIGDAVNVTARLEGLTKEYGRSLLIAEAAAEMVGDCFRLQFIDCVTMKGKSKALRVYSVVSRQDALLDPNVAAYLEAYDLAQASYTAGNLNDALSLFEKCLHYSPDDTLLRLYIQRCKRSIEHPMLAE